MPSFLIVGGLSPLSSRGLVPLLLARPSSSIVLLDNLSSLSSSGPSDDPRVSFVPGDSFDEKLVGKILREHKIDYVIDVATLSTPSPTATPVEVARNSVVGFTHLLDAVRHYGGVRGLVLVSRRDSSNQRESLPPSPSSLLGASAMAAEAMLHSYVVSYRLPLVVARLSEGVVGAGLSRGVNEAIAQSVAGELKTVPEGPYSLISIGDAAEGVLAVLEKGVAPEIYNIGAPFTIPSSCVDACIRGLLSNSSTHCDGSSKATAAENSTKALKELEWAPANTNPLSIIRETVEELRKAQSPTMERERASPRVLVFGGETWMGRQMVSALKGAGVAVVMASSQPGVERDEVVREEMASVAPSHVLCAIDTKEAVEGEPWPATLLENTRTNLYAPWMLASTCDRVRCHFTYLGTGSIFAPDGILHSEEEMGKAKGSSYAAVKKYTDKLLRHFPSTLQIRLGLPVNIDNDDNNVVVSVVSRGVSIGQSSISFLPDCLPAVVDLLLHKETGIFNVANPGAVSSIEIGDAYRDIVNPREEEKREGGVEGGVLLETSRMEGKTPLRPATEAIRLAIREVYERKGGHA